MLSSDAKTSFRKQEHLDICRTEDVSSTRSTGFENIQIPHVALPETDFQDISTQCTFLGKEYSAPLLISSMTGGSPEGERLNQLLAQFAQSVKIPMGVGSTRVAIENRDPHFFEIRKFAPRAELWANIGAVQLNYGVEVDDLNWVIENLEATALVIHANPLQECIQAEGDRNFSNLLRKIETLAEQISVPLILKETGCGIDLKTAKSALSAGVQAIDVAGRGGTHWGFIEGLRSSKRRALGDMFREWGLSTADSLKLLRAELGAEFPLIASGGIRNGLEAAKGLFLGAHFCGMAMPFLKEASKGEEALMEFFNLQCEALKIAMFCSGSKNVAELRKNA